MERIKYLGIYLPKETKDLYIENYKTLVGFKKNSTYNWDHVVFFFLAYFTLYNDERNQRGYK